VIDAARVGTKCSSGALAKPSREPSITPPLLLDQ
jgi:hypothetical protein